MELLISIAYHIFYIFLVQGLLYLFYASQLEKEVVNRFIAKQLYKAISKNQDVKNLVHVILPFIRLPQTCIHYENNHWKDFLLMFLLIAFLIVVICSLFVNILSPETPIVMIAMWNLGIFAGIAIVEFFFFKHTVVNYSEVSLRDILEAIRTAIKESTIKN